MNKNNAILAPEYPMCNTVDYFMPTLYQFAPIKHMGVPATQNEK